MTALFQQRATELINAGAWLSERGLVPATSGNLSARIADNEVAITVSGRHKGQLGIGDIMRVDMQGRVLDQGADLQPSAETLLHLQLYRRFPGVNVVLHPHSAKATVLSRQRHEALRLSDYEILKAFSGVNTHATSLLVPIFENDQDMNVLAKDIEPFLRSAKKLHAYLIRGHGYYTWAEDMESALRNIEALEFLFECELMAG